ncbi:hypothetical protein MBANPS3_010218 [Mucor bainieri]
MLSESSDILTVQRAQYINWCNNRNFLSSPLIMPTNSKQVETAISKRSASLPPELLVEIFTYLDGNQPTLHSISLVCKQWFYCAAPILYGHPQINDTYSWATFILTLTRERMSFFYGDLIRSIDLSSGKSIEAMKDQEFFRRLSGINDNEPQDIRQVLMNRHAALGAQLAGTNTNNRIVIPSPREYRNTESERRRQENEYVVKGLPFIIVSTSSLIQVSKTCKNLTSLNLSYTSLLHDSVIAETGEYLSTLQRYAVQPGLTHIQIPIEDAIEAIGKSCCQLEQVKIQRCEWVTAQVIWLFAYHCPNLKRLDARRSTKCTVKKLIANVIELPGYHGQCANRRGEEDGVALPPQAMSNDNGSTTTATLAFQRLSNRGRLTVEGDGNDIVDDDGDNDVVPAFVVEAQTGDHEEDAPMIHFRFNEETGLWEREVNGQLRQMQDDADAIRNNGTFWFVPLPNTQDDVPAAGRRPPSPAQHTLSSQSMPSTEDKSLKDIVRTAIMDCKNSGGINLNWISDYN